MTELDPQKLDPFNFLLWEKIKQTARKRRKSKCNWKPFIVHFSHLADRIHQRTIIFNGNTFQIMSTYYASGTSMPEMVKKFGGTNASITKMAEDVLIKLIRLARESLVELPCGEYYVCSKERKDAEYGGGKVPCFHQKGIFARSSEEAIELCQKYRADSHKWDLIAEFVGAIGSPDREEDDEITFV